MAFDVCSWSNRIYRGDLSGREYVVDGKDLYLTFILHTDCIILTGGLGAAIGWNVGLHLALSA